MADGQLSYRPPWLALHFVGIAGGSGSGKSTFARAIIEALDVPWVVIISLDSFYKTLTKEQSEAAFRSEYDFDHPDALDWDLLFTILRDLKQGKKVQLPIYNFTKHARDSKTTTLYGANVIIFEGIFALHDKRILELLDLKIYLETDTDECFERRLRRDMTERGRDRQGIIDQYNTFVKPNFLKYVTTQSKAANIITTGTEHGAVMLKTVVDNVQVALTKKSLEHQKNLKALKQDCESKAVPETITILEQSNQVRGIHTIIRNHDTGRDDFIFYLERLALLTIEAAIAQCLPHIDKQIQTKLGTYAGKELSLSICGVSVIRAGEIFETSLRQVVRDCQIGKLLIQSDQKTGEPHLHYLKLPPSIRDSHVFLFDAQIATGWAALMALRILLDHGVEEERIIFVTIIASPVGAKAIATVYPKVRIVSSAMDDGLVGISNYITPGAGNLGERYFGA